MSRLLTFILIASLLANCNTPSQKPNEKMSDAKAELKRDTFSLLCQYWELQDAESPTDKDVAFVKDEGSQYLSGIIFMTDSTILENPKGEMTYGKFSMAGKTLDAKYDGGREAKYTIGRINDKELLLRRVEGKRHSELTYKASKTYWKDSDKNPFAKQNYQWARKPAKSETTEEIKKRAKESVLFYAYYFEGFVNGGADEISFKGIPCCFKWYTGGITIQGEKTLDTKWADCFYSKAQAFEARKILEDAIVKKYDWDTTQSNWLQQTALVLKQVYKGL